MSAAVYILSTVTGYMLTSALLLKCPGLLHRRKKETFISRHISHRGGQRISFDYYKCLLLSWRCCKSPRDSFFYMK